VPHQTACAALAAAPDDTNPYSTSKLAASQRNAAASTSFTADPALHFWNNPGILTSSFISRESRHNLLFHRTKFVNHKSLCILALMSYFVFKNLIISCDSLCRSSMVSGRTDRVTDQLEILPMCWVSVPSVAKSLQCRPYVSEMPGDT